jgi:hypothetical protein
MSLLMLCEVETGSNEYAAFVVSLRELERVVGEIYLQSCKQAHVLMPSRASCGCGIQKSIAGRHTVRRKSMSLMQRCSSCC